MDDPARGPETVGGPLPTRPPSPRVGPPTPRVALMIATLVVLGFLLWQGREALSPFVVGLLLVYLLNPAVDRLDRLGLPRWIAILVVYAVVVVVIVQGLALMLGPLVDQVRSFAADLPGLISNLERYYRSLDIPPQLREAIDNAVAGIGRGVDVGVLLPVVNITAGFVSSIFGYLIIPVWAFYLLKDRFELMAAANRALPESWRSDVWAIGGIVERVFSQWIRAQIVLGLTVGVATFVGLLILNALVDPVFGRFALLLAIIAGIFELLPIIGPILAAIPAVLLALTAGPQAAIAALVLYALVQQVENNILVPKIQGDAVELHPSIVIFSLVIGGAIAGLLGAILALPMTAAGRNVFRYLFRRLSPPGAEPLPEPGSEPASPSSTGPAAAAGGAEPEGARA